MKGRCEKGCRISYDLILAATKMDSNMPINDIVNAITLPEGKNTNTETAKQIPQAIAPIRRVLGMANNSAMTN